MQRIANGAIGSGQLNLAHHVLEEATNASSQITVPLMRDQRLIAIVTSLNFLTDALLRSGRENLAPIEPLSVTEKAPAPVTANPPVAAPAPAPPAEALPKRPDINVTIRMARLEWNRAVYLASNIGNPTYRNEMLYKVAESVASGSASLAIDFSKAVGR